MDIIKNKYFNLYNILLIVAICDMGIIRVMDWGPVYGISTFVMLVLVLYLSLVANDRRDLIHLCIAIMIGYSIRFWGLLGLATIDVGFTCAIGVIIYVLLRINKWIVADRELLVTTFVFPALWMGAYLLFMMIKLPAIFRIDMMFFDIKPIIATEAAITSYGLSFIVLWVASLLVHCIRFKKARSGVLCILVSVALVAGGIVIQKNAKVPAAYVKVGYVTGAYVGDFISFVDVDMKSDIESFDYCVKQAVEQGVDVLAFNEETYEVTDLEYEYFLSYAGKKAAENDIQLLIGFDIHSISNASESNNRIVWIDYHGEVKAVYDKTKLIPGIEAGYIKGNGEIPCFTTEINGQPINVAMAICYDSNFPTYFSQLSPDTDILFLPSWDWKGITKCHYRICGAIAVERNVTVLKPTYDGDSVAIDGQGNILKKTNTGVDGFEKVCVVELPIKGGAK